jgi:hypothetical protein
MKKPLIALCLLAFSLPLGCGVDEETPPDPLATRDGFCKSWGEAVCQERVVDNCASPSVEDCIEAQTGFCLDTVPKSYSSVHAASCLEAVKGAYEDLKLSADEIAVVIKLAAPCDQLSSGTVDEGRDCTKADDCNTAGGLTCVIKSGAAKGKCETPEVVSGGKACGEPEQVCDEDFYCNGKNCLAYVESGESCEADYECQPTDRCVIPIDATTLSCQPRLGRSEPCEADADCASLYCSMAEGDTEGLCADNVVLSQREPLCAALR